VAASLLAGMIVGQLIGGVLGDVLGRRRAMLLVMILQIGGSLGSALFVTTDATNNSMDDDQKYHTHTALEELARWRFILGIGAGGV
jgi:PHS family inorganic phosphate transporter-like MFS transporter